MKGLLCACRRRFFWYLLLSFTGISFLGALAAQAIESSGLTLTLHPDKTQYALNEPIQLIMVLKNAEGNSIVTNKDFSKTELHEFLSVIDPGGMTHTLSLGPMAHGMPPPFFWRDKEWNLTETLPENFVLSETVHDLTILFPVLKKMTGWYTIRARVSGARYAESATAVHGRLGRLGEIGNVANWEGTINSNEIQVFISPGYGALFQLKVLDQAARPLPEIRVKVFKDAEIPPGADLADIWSGVDPVLTGTTNFNGMVQSWEMGSPCQSQNDYTAIAYYQGGYGKAVFEAGDAGWVASDCSGLIAKQIVFGETTVPFPPLSAFSALALNSVWVRAGAVIYSGHIGVMDASPGLWLDSGVEVSIGFNARVEDGVRIYGDSVKLWGGAAVDEVYYNDLQNDGTIRGEAVTPLSLPLPIVLPLFPEITPGTENVNVRIWRTTTLNPGKYRDISVGIRGTLRLSEGVYHFRNLNLGAGSQLVCLGPGPTEVRIKERMYPGLNAKIGPAPESGLSAKDLVFYIEGTNGNLWDLLSYPRAAGIGLQNEVKANMYVPNGTISLGAGSNVQGSFIAQSVVVGVNVKVHLEGGF